MNRYLVKRVNETVGLDGAWDKGVWEGVEAVEIVNWMGDEPEHKPCSRAKLLYDDEAIYVNFKVVDKYVRAVAQGYQGSVWEDSCVELFFTPGEDVGQGYFNVETNCGGTMLFCHQTLRGVDVTEIPDKWCDKVEIYHSLPVIVEPEIADDTQWSLQYRLPFEVVNQFAPVFVKPASGAHWRANLYKCGDETSKPHWLTWNVIDKPQPDFHVPGCFGVLEFE